MKANSIGFIGGGRITKIFLTALKQDANFHKKIVVSDINNDLLDNMKTNFQGIETTNQSEYASKQNIVFIALHPPVVTSVLNEINGFVKTESIIISLAPKLKMSFISEKLNSHKNIVRSIPNSPSIIHKGFNPLSFYKDFDAGMKNDVFEIFENLGEYFEAEENNLETYAIITAMGPTYLQFQLNRLMNLAIEFGLNESESKLAVKNMVEGMNSLLFESNLSYDQIEDLIPVKPIQEGEQTILNIYDEKLKLLYGKLTS